MFGFLSLIGQGLNYFGFFNIGSRGNRLLNRIMIAFGALGDLYLFYIGWRFTRNQDLLRGWLLLLIALFIMYWLVTNFYYYFLGRTASFDVSPKLEKRLGLHRFNHVNGQSLAHIQNLPQERSFIRENIRHAIPAVVKMTPAERRNVQQVAHDMVHNGHLNANYDGMSSNQIVHQLARQTRPLYAIGAGALIPFSTVRQLLGRYVVYAGDSRFNAYPVGYLARIGFQSAQELQRHADRFQLHLVSVVLMGGPYWVPGRSRYYEHRQGYTLQVNVKLSSRE